MRTAIQKDSHHHCKFRHHPQHPHREGLQADLKSGHFFKVPPHHHSQHFRRAHVSHCCLTRHPENSAARYSHCMYASTHCSMRLLERSELSWNLTESHRMATQGSLEWLTFRLHLEEGFHQQILFWLPAGPLGIQSTFTFFLFSWWSNNALLGLFIRSTSLA